MKELSIVAMVERILAEVIPGFLSLSAQNPGSILRPDILAKVGNQHVAIEVKSVPLSVVEDVLARLSMGALQAKRVAEELDALPMVLVVVPSLGPKIKKAAMEFMTSHAPETAWALLDKSGNARIMVPGLGLDETRRVARVRPARPGRSSVQLFSDINRWLLKVLLLGNAPAKFWNGPRQDILTLQDLGNASKVSPEMVRRFANAFEGKDFLRRTKRGLRVIRRPELLDLWRSDERLRTRPGVPVRRIIGDRPDSIQTLGEASASDDVIAAGFEACRMLGLLHAVVPSLPEMHVLAPVAGILERLDLEECSPEDADFALLPCRNTRSVLRGSVIRNGVRVADAFQAALDVLRHPARGQEQSDYIVSEVLHLVEDGR